MNKRPTLIIVGLLSLSVVLGVLSFLNYRTTERHLRRVLMRFEAQGRTLSVDGCVDAVLSWRKGCHGPKVLCDSYAAPAMRSCLRARDRATYCRSLTGDTETTRFGYQDCKRRGVNRQTKKACAAAFRMVTVHCRAYRREARAQGGERSPGTP